MNDSKYCSLEQLADYVESRITPELRAGVTAHLASGCSRCSDNLAFLRRMRRAAEATAWPTPPVQVHRLAVKAFRSSALPQRTGNLSMTWRMLLTAFAIVAILVGVVYISKSEYEAAVAEVTGTVEMQLAPGAAWQPALVGQAFPVGAILRTLADGQVMLSFPGAERVQLGSNTQLQLTALAQKNGQWQLTMVQANGETEHWVLPETGVYRLQTPAGEIVAQEAHFGVRIGADDAVMVSADKGAITVNGAMGSVLIPAGQSVLLPPGSAPTVLATMPPSSTPTAIMTTASPSKPSPVLTNTATQTPLPEGTPSGTPEPGETQSPEDTDAPEETQSPEDTDAPEETQQPEDTDAPEETQQPEDTDAPEETQQPEDAP